MTRPSEENGERKGEGIELAVIVPVYRELSNGNIRRLLEDFNEQNIGAENYQVVFIVNNSPKVALGKGDIYQENQKTIEVLEFAGRLRSNCPSIDAEFRAVLDRTREKLIRIMVLDHSSDGIERCIGRIRGIGVTAIVETSSREDVVAQMDADTRIRRDYVEKIIKHFLKKPELESLFLSLDHYTPQGAAVLFKTTCHFQFNIAWNRFLDALKKVFAQGSPQIVCRMRSLEKIGGIPQHDMGEDSELSRRLSEATCFEFAPEIMAQTSDRAREDGYDARFRVGNEYRNRKYKSFKVKMLAMELMKADLNSKNESEIQSLFQKYGVSFDKAQYVKHFKTWEPSPSREYEVIDYLSQMDPEYVVEKAPSDYVEELVSFFSNHSPESEFNTLKSLIRKYERWHQLKMHFAKKFIKKLDTKKDLSLQERRFLNENPWILDELEENSLETIQKEFPDFFGELKDSAIRLALARLSAITHFLKLVRNEPKDYPVTNQFILDVQD